MTIGADNLTGADRAAPVSDAGADWLRLKVANRRNAARDIVSFDLVDPTGAPLPPFAAGAHVDVRAADGVIRQYSISNPPSERHRYRLGVLLDPKSRGASTAIHAGFSEGSIVEIGVPRNLFPIADISRPVLLLGGGIGITPILAMAYEVEAAGGAYSLHYCVRDRTRAAFLDELEGGPLAGHAHVHCDDGAPEQRLDLPALLAAADPAAHLYVCGPAGFIDYVLGTARGAGWAEDRLHSESFDAAADLTGDSFEVIAARSGTRLTVPAGRSIADVLMEAGIDVIVSCEQGICGACLTDVIEGTPDHRDLIQDEEEKASNRQVALCCSRSRTPVLRLDI